MSDDSYPGAGWQGRFRTAAGGLRSLLGEVRFDPDVSPTEGVVTGPIPLRGVMICDPAVAAATWSIGPATDGALQNTPTAIGVTPDGLFLVTIRRGGGASTGGCGGGTFPGWHNGGSPACFGTRQTIFEKYPIAADGKVAQVPTVGGSWNELIATASFKGGIVINDAGTLACAIQPAATSKLMVIDVATGALLGSVNTSTTNNSTAGEPVWIGTHCYWPDPSTNKIFDYDASTPATPTETIFAQPTLTSVQALRADGVILYACGTAGFASHTVEPLAEVDTVTGIGNWQSMAYDETADVIVAFRKFDASNISYATIDVAGTTLTLNTQADDIAATVGSVMDGSGCIAHEGVAICYSEKRALSGADTLDAHQFGILDPAAVFLEQTLNFTHTGGAGNVGPVASPKFNALGMRGVFTFNSGSDARVLVPDFTDVEIPLPKCVAHLPVDLGGAIGASHGALADLDVPADHPWAVLIDGTRAWTGEMDCGGQLLDNAPFLRGYIDGLTTEIDASDTSHDVQVNPGACADSLVSNDKIIEVSGAFTKRIDAAWAAGDTNGGMATGSVANGTEYNLIILEKDSDGTIDMMFDVSVTGANAPAGYTARRRIGSVLTDGSANIRMYEQFGDRFVLEQEIFDVNDGTGTVGTFETATASVPANMMGLISVDARADSCTNLGFRLRPTGSSVTTNVKSNLLDGAGTATRQLKWEVNFLVDGSSQYEYTLFAQGSGFSWVHMKLYTRGWIDDRGRHA